MDNIMTFILAAVKITLLDLALCGDNIGVIALATRRLSKEFAKKASMLGVAGAIGLRILFACLITVILSIQWLPIKLLGGLLLVKITWDFIKPSQEEEDHNVKTTNKFWEAVLIIIVADISMSLDNVLAIAGAAGGNISAIIFGVLLNIPIIFFGSQIVSELMKKYEIIVYIGGAVLAHTSIKMILEDNLTIKYLKYNEAVISIVPIIAAVLVIVYGMYMISLHKGKNKQSIIDNKNYDSAAKEVSTTITDDKDNVVRNK